MKHFREFFLRCVGLLTEQIDLPFYIAGAADTPDQPLCNAVLSCQFKVIPSVELSLDMCVADRAQKAFQLRNVKCCPASDIQHLAKVFKPDLLRHMPPCIVRKHLEG